MHNNSIFKGYGTLAPNASKSTWNTTEQVKNFLKSEDMNENINWNIKFLSDRNQL